MRRLSLFLLTAAFLAGAITCLAQPSEQIRYLMQEPASLFDLGMYKLNNYLQSYRHESRRFQVEKSRSTARYDQEENIIRIEIDLFPKTKQFDKPKALCIEATESIKLRLRDEMLDYRHQFFSHAGYDNPKRPGGVLQELEKIMEIVVHIHRKTADSTYPVDMYSRCAYDRDDIIFSQENPYELER